MDLPESMKTPPPNDSYKADAWRTWSIDDLRKWAELLERRSWMRNDTEAGVAAATKDRADAAVYRGMLAARLKETL